MRVLGIVPARGGSKGIPGKNLADLGGMPLLRWTAIAAAGSRLSRTVLTTDDDAIAAEGRRSGLDVPFIRPDELATDRASALDVAIHALGQVDEAFASYDAVMLLQPTTPFRSSGDIDDAIRLLETTGADSVIAVVEAGGHHPARMKLLDGDRLIDPPYAEAEENQPRQELVPHYLRNGAVYLTRVSTLRRRSFKGVDSRALVMPAERSVNIDEPLDLLLARALVAEGIVDLPRSGSVGGETRP